MNNKKMEGFVADKNGNLKRRQDFVVKKNDNEILQEIKEGNVFGQFVISGIDLVVNNTIKMFNNIFVFCFKDGFNSMSNTSDIGNINKEELARSSLYIDYVYLRYLITLILPPIGIFLSKGIKYGWVNILIASILCYINYIVAIIYAFVITFHNKYADMYFNKQKKNLQKYKTELKEIDNIDLDKRKRNLLSIFVLLVIFLGMVYGIIKLFNKTRMNK